MENKSSQIAYRLPTVVKDSLEEMAHAYGISLPMATTMVMMSNFNDGQFSFNHPMHSDLDQATLARMQSEVDYGFDHPEKSVNDDDFDTAFDDMLASQTKGMSQHV